MKRAQRNKVVQRIPELARKSSIHSITDVLWDIEILFMESHHHQQQQ